MARRPRAAGEGRAARRLPRAHLAEARAGRRQPEGAVSAVKVELAIAEVVVFEDRARVIRRGQVAAGDGQVRIEVAPIAPVVVDKSVVARVSGGAAQVRDVQVRREVAPWRAGAEDPRVAAAERAALE